MQNQRNSAGNTVASPRLVNIPKILEFATLDKLGNLISLLCQNQATPVRKTLPRYGIVIFDDKNREPWRPLSA